MVQTLLALVRALPVTKKLEILARTPDGAKSGEGLGYELPLLPPTAKHQSSFTVASCCCCCCSKEVVKHVVTGESPVTLLDCLMAEVRYWGSGAKQHICS